MSKTKGSINQRRAEPGTRLRHRAELVSTQIMWGITRILPSGPLLGAAAWLGRVILPRSAAAARVEANLTLVRPETPAARRREICAEVGDNFARLMIEYLMIPRMAARRRWRVEGAEVVEAACASGRGAVYITGHFGNWEVCRLAAAQLGAPMGIFYRAFNNPLFDEFGMGMIAGAGEPVLRKSVTGLRDFVRHVRGGGAMLVLIDQRISGAPLIPFMGKPAETATTAADIALKLGVPLIPVRARRGRDGRSFDVRFEPPIPPSTSGEMMTEANARLARWIDEDPGQWFWLHQRWRRRDDRKGRGAKLRA